MRLLGTKSLGLAIMLAALVAVGPSRAYSYVIQVYPDSVVMSTAVGTSTDGYISISDGRDTLPNLPKGTVHVYYTGSSQFTILTDSVLQFVGYTYIQVRYSPTNIYGATGQLRIVGDSNTVYVALVGNPVSHFNVQLLLSSYDSLHANQKLCQNFSAYNTNADSIHITQIILTDDPRPGIQWSLANLPSLPMVVPAHASWSIGQLCALMTASDDSDIYGSLKIVYTYPGGTDSTTVTLQGHRWPVDASCIAVSGTDFGAVQEGGTMTRSIMLANTTNGSVTLDSVQIAGTDYNQFTINSPSFPLTIPASSTASVSITYAVPSPSTKDNYSATFEALVSGTSRDGVPCTSLLATITGSVSIPIVDTITLDAPPGTSTLSITTHTTKSRHMILIHNVGTNRILLQYLMITDSSFAFFGSPGNMSAGMYDSLNVGATSGPVILTLEAPDTGIYNINLTLFYVVQQAHRRTDITSQKSYHYTIVAHRLPALASSVGQPALPAADFTLMPNPARGEVTMLLPQDGSSTVEIYDVLGNLLLRKQASGQFVWDGSSGSSSAASGSYIVRVIEHRADGTIASSSKRLVYLR